MSPPAALNNQDLPAPERRGALASPGLVHGQEQDQASFGVLSRPAARRLLQGAVGPVLILAIWTLLATTVFTDGKALPTPISVFHQMWQDRLFYVPQINTTLQEAGLGWLWGNALALVFIVLYLFVPALERITFNVALALYVLPVVATAPILEIILSGKSAKVALAAQGVFFLTLIGASLGLRAADQGTLDVVNAFGGSRWCEIRKVRIRSALPAVVSALQMTVPAAILGAIIGEFLGGSSGLGVAMVTSEQSLFVTRTWGLAIVTSMIAGAGYVLCGLVGRAFAVGEREIATTAIRQHPASWRSSVANLLYTLASFGVLLLIWAVAIRVMNLNSFFAKGPSDVFRFLLTESNAAANRHLIFGDLGVTLQYAGLGFALGTIAAMTMGCLIVLSPIVETAVLPVAVAVRSIPLVAMTPLIAQVFGRGGICAVVIGALVTFFPTLVNMVYGLRSMPPSAGDLLRVFGAGRGTTLIKAQLPYCVPAIFASARIAGPSAILGVLLAEFLVTGKGIGSLMVSSLAQSDYITVWAATAVVTGLSLAIYAIASAAEGAAYRRYMM